MTFAEGVMHLVRIGARGDEAVVTSPSSASSPRASTGAARAAAELPPAATASAIESLDRLGEIAPGAPEQSDNAPQPGREDLEASVALVAAGLATRVTLTGFPSWPGLLWRAYRLADVADVMIIPTVVRPGGRVDIVITRGGASGG